MDQGTADQEAAERFYGSGLVIALALEQVLAFEERVRSLTGDAELQQARMAFDAAVGPGVKEIRDLAAHLADYAIGKGHRQTGKRGPPLISRNVHQTPVWMDTGETHLTLGEDQINLHAAARTALELARVVERVRETHLEAIGQELARMNREPREDA